MPIAPSVDTTFLLSNVNLLTSTLKPAGKTRLTFPANRLTISSSSGNTPDGPKKENQLVKVVAVTLEAGVLTLSSVNVDSAFAAKSGGRVGGQAFKSAAPRASSPRMNNSRTNIYVNPPVAPPLIGGYGYGYGVPYYGGYGWSPFSFFAPGPGVAVGVGGGFEFFFLFILLGVVSAVFRRFFSSRDEDLDDF